MKRINTKSSKRIVAVILAAVAAVTVMGCSVEKTVTIETSETTETSEGTETSEAAEAVEETEETNNEIVTYEFETFDGVNVIIDENNIVVQEACEDPENSELVSAEAAGNIIAPGRDFVYLEDNDYYYVADLSRNLITVANKSNDQVESAEAVPADENPGYFETDSWSISYDTEKWYGYMGEDGSVIINYLGEAAGSSFIEITELDVATASEAVAMLEEKKGKELKVVDDIQLSDEYSCTAFAEDEIYEPGLYIADFYIVYEHNGKVIVVDEAVTHDDDDARAEALADIFLEVTNTLELK